jgi:hypothetical protein
MERWISDERLGYNRMRGIASNRRITTSKSGPYSIVTLKAIIKALNDLILRS